MKNITIDDKVIELSDDQWLGLTGISRARGKVKTMRRVVAVYQNHEEAHKAITDKNSETRVAMSVLTWRTGTWDKEIHPDDRYKGERPELQEETFPEE